MVAEEYHLKSDLARVCLPHPQGHPDRVLAWVNSICFLFLVVAFSGVRPRLPMPKNVPPLEQSVPIIVQPLPPPPQPQQAPTTAKEESSEDHAPSAQVVVVTPMSPSINFSVPTIGNVIVPNAIAAPPPVAQLQTAPAAVHNEPKTVRSTGQAGDRPDPQYPEAALRFGQQGTVVLLLTVDESGVVQSVEVTESSGSPILDRGAREFVKRHWVLPAGKGGRQFLAPITFKLQ